MPTSRQTSELSSPTGDERVPASTFAYMQTRNRFRVFSLILEEFERSGISKATLARRLGKGPEQVSRLLGSPGNLTLDTVSDVLFAISGAEPTYDVSYPLKKPARNYTRAEWLEEEGPSRATAGVISIRPDFMPTPRTPEFKPYIVTEAAE